MRVVATAVAGGAIAAAGQVALTEALPAIGDDANLLHVGVEKLAGATPHLPSATDAAATAVDGLTPALLEPVTTTVPAATEPATVDVTELIKAAGLQRRAAEAPSRATEIAASERTSRTGLVSSGTSTSPRAVQMLAGRITSGFGPRWGSQHRGLDIAAPIGTPIRVPLAGTVINSGPASGFGLWVRVRHSDGTTTVYGHINRSNVTVGEKVTAGQVIAEVGNRGISTGSHLHMEVVQASGGRVDPRRWLAERGTRF